MHHSVPKQTRIFILRAFADANPVFCYSLFKDDTESDIRHEIARFLNGSPTLYGSSGRILEAFGTWVEGRGYQAPKRFSPVFHVFPVFVESLNAGFMVPLNISPADDWDASDAFGTFGTGKEKNPGVILQDFLKRIEKAWKQKNGCSLPLRWKKALTMRVMCPVHMDAIKGDSLQVPLVIALLRALAAQSPTTEHGPTMPLGNTPVFATGKLLHDDSFKNVEELASKLEGFVREYGPGLPAVLTSDQIEELNDHRPGLLSLVSIHTANNLAQLFDLEAFKEPLRKLCKAAHPTEVGELLGAMRRKSRRLRFLDVHEMAEWLGPLIHSPVHRFDLEYQTGLVLAHKGMFPEARGHFLNADTIARNHSDVIGINELVQLMAAWGVIAVGACQPELVSSLVDKVGEQLHLVSPKQRAAWWGTLCQVYRIAGKFDEAVHAGEEAVKFADLADTINAARDRNYLIHALLARARSGQGKPDEDRSRAKQLLAESKSKWLPRGNDFAAQSNLGFCLHLEAEIARQEGKPFMPPSTPPWEGVWGHPWMFTLYACARNPANALVEQKSFADRLVKESRDRIIGKSSHTIFRMLHYVYLLLNASINGTGDAEAIQSLDDWVDNHKRNGFPGWDMRFSSFLIKIKYNDQNSIIDLCESVPYH
jgi:hypothetical protein